MRTATVLLFVLLAATTSRNQMRPSTWPKDQIWIGVNLQLGMSKSIVMSNLGENYDVVKIKGSGDNWLINSKAESNIGLGMMGFHNDRLTYISKDWTQGDEDAPALAEAIHTALDGFTNEGRSVCTLKTTVTRSSAAELKYVILACGAKRLQLLFGRGFSGAYKGSHAQVNEILSSETER